MPSATRKRCARSSPTCSFGSVTHHSRQDELNAERERVDVRFYTESPAGALGRSTGCAGRDWSIDEDIRNAVAPFDGAAAGQPTHDPADTTTTIAEAVARIIENWDGRSSHLGLALADVDCINDRG